MYCVTKAKLKGIDEETSGYNPRPLDKCSDRSCQPDKLYKSAVLYGGVKVLLFLLSLQGLREKAEVKLAQF